METKVAGRNCTWPSGERGFSGLGGAVLHDAAVSSNTDANSRSSGVFYHLGINQAIFRWGTAKAAADAGRIQWQISQKNYREAYRMLLVSLRSQYVGLVAKKMVLRNLTFTRDQTVKIVALEEDKLRNGRISQNDIVLPRLQLEEISLQVERAAEDFANSKRIFQRQAGLTELPEESIPGAIPDFPFEPTILNPMLQKFLAVGWEEDLIVQVNREWVRYSDMNYRIAKYRLYPMINFGASISQSNSTNATETFVDQVGVLSKYVGISANWSIFDGFATRGAKMHALATKRYWERQLQNHVAALQDQARSLERQVAFASRAMGLAAMRHSLAESAVRTRQDELARGLTSQAILESAIGSQQQSQLNLTYQQIDLLARWSEFVSTVGQDPMVLELPVR